LEKGRLRTLQPSLQSILSRQSGRCVLLLMRLPGASIAINLLNKSPILGTVGFRGFMNVPALTLSLGYTPAANPNEKNILYKVLQLLRLNIQLIFVADGPKRPKKRGKIPRMLPEKETELLRKTLGHLGVPWHQAPAEAEAECAEMQRLGVVDAVWTDDGDCLMFGCQVVIRFYYNNDNMDLKKQKDLSKIRIYRASTLSAKFPSLDREGLVLWAVIGGGDYDHKGLVGCGPVRILELVKSSLGKSLCRAFENGSLQSWRKELQAQLQKGGSSVSIPEQ